MENSSENKFAPVLRRYCLNTYSCLHYYFYYLRTRCASSWSKRLRYSSVSHRRYEGCQVSETFEPPHDKTNKMTVRPAKTQISLGIRPVWSETSLCAQRVAEDPSLLHADSEDSDQTRRMPRLIWVFAKRNCHFVGFIIRRLILYSLSNRYSLTKGIFNEHL